MNKSPPGCVTRIFVAPLLIMGERGGVGVDVKGHECSLGQDWLNYSSPYCITLHQPFLTTISSKAQKTKSDLSDHVLNSPKHCTLQVPLGMHKREVNS